MKKINERLLVWASDIEDGTLRQAEKTARLPIVRGHVALMPDAHVGIGATVGSVIPTATQHIAKAKTLAKSLGQHLEDPAPASFVQSTPEFETYIADMLWAQDYALANREQMMDSTLRELVAFVGSGGEVRRINCHHNFTQRETHVLDEVATTLWITRKGAIKADVDDFGVIPGSMGTRSYIVRGRGLAESWCSCSHGAGRRLSRTAAKQKYSVQDLKAQMHGKTWLADKASALLDEIPAAYKDIDRVMADQADLVEIQHTLRQVLNYKGC